MLPKNYAQLLFNAVRETLETMAFAEVIPCSIRIGQEELRDAEALDDFVLNPETFEPASVPTAAAPEDSWGTMTPETTADTDTADPWGTPAVESAPPADDWGSATPSDEGGDAWGTTDSWGEPPKEIPESDDSWGESTTMVPPSADPWGDTAAGNQAALGAVSLPAREINFDEMMENQEDWIWSQMRVNSPEINTVLFVVSKELAMELARNMYAGEDLQLDSPIIRDLVAELTNVLGGRLMLLLENLGGKFTLTVPEIGIGFPKMPEGDLTESVLCRVLVDGEFPVIVSLTFNPGIKEN